MSAWLWLVAAVVFVVIEVTNLAFFALFAALGAVAAAVVSAAGGPAFLQVVVFVVAALGGLVVLRRPLSAFGHRRAGALKSGVAALVGQRATVVDRVDRAEVGGCVHARGEDWPAITYDEQPCEPGQVVEVIDIEKTRLVVTAS